MKNTKTNITIQLDTLADLLEWDIKQHEKTARKIGNLYEASDQILKTLGKENAALIAVAHEITKLNTELKYWVKRCDKNFNRYNDLIDEVYECLGENYIPERGPDWVPNWSTGEDDYDKPEPSWDSMSRHDSNEGW